MKGNQQQGHLFSGGVYEPIILYPEYKVTPEFTLVKFQECICGCRRVMIKAGDTRKIFTRYYIGNRPMTKTPICLRDEKKQLIQL